MTGETEIKFAIGDDAEAAASKLFAKDRPVTVESTYFDTSDLKLRRRGVQLRVRRDGDQLLQTVKLPDSGSGPLTRGEHEVPLKVPEPDLDHLANMLPDDMRPELSHIDVKPVFTTRFTRRRHMIGDGTIIAEAALDQGEIISGDRRLPISEVEIELKGEDVDAFIDACLLFLDRIPTGLIVEGKAARGYRLRSGASPVPYYPEKLTLEADATLPQAMRIMMRHNFAHFLYNAPAVKAGVPEGIHQMRVGLRRLRSAVAAFKPVLDLAGAEEILSGVKGLFNTLGAVREADVFIAETLPSLRAAGLSEDLGEAVVEACNDHRENALADARSLLGGPEVARLVVMLNGWIEAGRWLRQDRPLDRLLKRRLVRDFALPRLRKLHKSLVKKGRKARSGTLKDWHQARIAAKKLRYTADPLLPTLGLSKEAADTYRKRIETLQDHLGRLNDLDTAEDFLGRLIRESGANQRKALKAARRVLHRWQAEQADRLIVQAARAFRDFEREGFRINRGRMVR